MSLFELLLLEPYPAPQIIDSLTRLLSVGLEALEKKGTNDGHRKNYALEHHSPRSGLDPPLLVILSLKHISAGLLVNFILDGT